MKEKRGARIHAQIGKTRRHGGFLEIAREMHVERHFLSVGQSSQIARKLAVADDRRLEFAGPAKVFESAQHALDGVKAGLVEPGQVVVLRGLGVTGSPGMGMASALVFALDGANLTGQVAVVTDGQLSGLVNKGIVVGEISPEAAAGGPLGLVRDGDLIRIDVLGRTADLDVPADELAARKAELAARPTARSAEVGWLSVYQRLVRPLPEGAVLRPRPKESA